MGFWLLKKIGVLFLLISASLLSTSFAGRLRRSTVNKLNQASAANQELHHDKISEVHKRLLRVNTKDYGRYDPAPALVKPPFKLIPN